MNVDGGRDLAGRCVSMARSWWKGRREFWWRDDDGTIELGFGFLGSDAVGFGSLRDDVAVYGRWRRSRSMNMGKSKSAVVVAWRGCHRSGMSVVGMYVLCTSDTIAETWKGEEKERWRRSGRVCYWAWVVGPVRRVWAKKRK